MQSFFTNVWLKPHKAFTQLSEQPSNNGFLYSFVILTGIAITLPEAALETSADDFSLISFLITNFFLGAARAIIAIIVLSTFLLQAAKIMRVSVTRDMLMDIWGYSRTPLIFIYLLLFISYVFFGEATFCQELLQEFIAENPNLSPLAITISITQLGLYLWHIILLIIGIKAYAQVPIGQSIATVAIGYLGVAIIFILIHFI